MKAVIEAGVREMSERYMGIHQRCGQRPPAEPPSRHG